MKKVKLGVLVSGSGTNLQAILNACKKSSYPAEVAVVISNNPEAYGLIRAQKAKRLSIIISHKDFETRESFEKVLHDTLKEQKVDYVILAGFMRILSPFFIKKWKNKILNIHPALLPSFPGTHAIQQAFDYGAKITGVTVHFVDEGTDTGPIILQEALAIKEGTSLKKLEESIHKIEHRLFPKAIELVSKKKIRHVGRKIFLGRS
ncbi:MAG: phosphoribosylglycinamide formyltransferase [Deltaproteobacteria bacterium]|nr:MAG: phosphoribosylglycinamide formyltransferase [Deltaproteobacteria bacterium]